MSHSLGDSYGYQAQRPLQVLLFPRRFCRPDALIWLGLQTGRGQDAGHTGAIPVVRPSGR